MLLRIIKGQLFHCHCIIHEKCSREIFDIKNDIFGKLNKLIENVPDRKMRSADKFICCAVIEC
jgi:hypothetical protein